MERNRDTMSSSAGSQGPLAGIRILEAGHILAGPYASMMLSDLGAEVTKVEPPTGDMSRQVSDAYFASLNRGKRSVCLDLTGPAGQEKLHELVTDAHALIVNQKPSAIRKLGLTYEALKQYNEKIVCVAVTGYGLYGSDDPAFDYVIQAATGVAAMTGEPDGPPTLPGYSAADNSAGLTAALGLLAQIIAGRGGQIDVSLRDVMLSQLNYKASAYLNEGAPPVRHPFGAHPFYVPAQLFPTADGFLAMFLTHDRYWRTFVTEAAVPEAEIAAFPTMADRSANRDKVVEAVTRALAADTARGWEARLRPLGIPVAAVRTLPEALAEAPDRVIETAGYRLVANPIRIDGHTTSYGPPPTLGEHGTA
ncbi:L-carnitine dehydratase/bile acid-inducible protein F [Pseudofrankia inefficax]|uniref:L-carnitine dehydratase/bile acid-inducible protein F n=2 Tax=Pseudofrankia inefficax (strain DSM 45817 / CECT 9037 / DDB 130130 / EuI1c) TaxID=298654 RepID=E3JAQ8_PSEI1|nr:L-carnitine dehydratase/bile acid-inducible protein F [Pseudofrankia inefficax]